MIGFIAAVVSAVPYGTPMVAAAAAGGVAAVVAVDATDNQSELWTTV